MLRTATVYLSTLVGLAVGSIFNPLSVSTREVKSPNVYYIITDKVFETYLAFSVLFIQL